MTANLVPNERKTLIPFQRYPQDTLTAIEAAVCTRWTIGIDVATDFAPMAAIAGALDPFPPAVGNVVSHDGTMRSNEKHGRH